MSKLSEIKELLIDKIKIYSENATIDEVEKLSAALSHLDMVERFDISKLYEGFVKENNESRERMSNFYKEALNKIDSAALGEG